MTNLRNLHSALTISMFRGYSLLLIVMLFSCESDDSTACLVGPQAGDVIIEFQHDATGQTFLAWTSNQAVIDQVESELALPFADRIMHINGRILKLPVQCDANLGWRWYFDPQDWSLAEFSIEVCDGEPQYVEDNLDEFVDVVGRYCPWGSRVVEIR